MFPASSDLAVGEIGAPKSSNSVGFRNVARILVQYGIMAPRPCLSFPALDSGLTADRDIGIAHEIVSVQGDTRLRMVAMPYPSPLAPVAFVRSGIGRMPCRKATCRSPWRAMPSPTATTISSLLHRSAGSGPGRKRDDGWQSHVPTRQFLQFSPAIAFTENSADALRAAGEGGRNTP